MNEFLKNKNTRIGLWQEYRVANALLDNGFSFIPWSWYSNGNMAPSFICEPIEKSIISPDFFVFRDGKSFALEVKYRSFDDFGPWILEHSYDNYLRFILNSGVNCILLFFLEEFKKYCLINLSDQTYDKRDNNKKLYFDKNSLYYRGFEYFFYPNTNKYSEINYEKVCEFYDKFQKDRIEKIEEANLNKQNTSDKIVNLIKNHGCIRKQAIADIIGCDSTTVFRNLKKLEEKGIISLSNDMIYIIG